MGRFWENKPVLSWVVDDFEQFNNILAQRNFNLDSYLQRYVNRSFSSSISRLLFNSPFSFNLGGQTKKSKLIATDKPIGVFNFSLAANTLYPLSEFYSEKLATDDPNRFRELNKPSGIVPNNFVEFIMVGGEKKYYYKDEKGVEYPCVKRIEGETEVLAGVPNARKKYASKTKKVYQTYKRKGGKVRYVELYSLFYYTNLGDSDLQYAIRHLPAMIVAEYLESVGVKVRIYMTRFVELSDSAVNLREYDLSTNQKLPMYDSPIVNTQNNRFSNQLLLQPIIAKEFQQEVHNPLAYLISSRFFYDVYEQLARNTIEKETIQGSISVYGYPNKTQDQMWEGFERYRNKYQEYVKLGIFKSKEVLPEAMIFFHDLSIKNNLNSFILSLQSDLNLNEEIDTLLQPEVNVFFSWWMKTSANTIKHKINIINSNELTKDLREIKSEIEETIRDVKNIIDKTSTSIKSRLEEFKGRIMRDLKITNMTLPNGSEVLNFDAYINNLVKESMVFGDGQFFATSEDEVERRTDFQQMIIEELKKV